jgi:hypothetical protein
MAFTDSVEDRLAADGAGLPNYREEAQTRRQQPPSLAGFLNTEYWLTRELKPPEALLGEVVTNTTRMFIGGPTGLGKSHLGMAMAAGMASGRGFLHWKASRACRVLYIDGEMARDLVQERLADLRRREKGADLSGLFMLCADDCDELSVRFPDLGRLEPLNTEAGQNFILRLIAKLGGIDAVFFDNRMSLLCGDMKEEQPWTDAMPLVKELTRQRVAQIWIDHTGHNAGQLYGTKTKEWQFDAVALLSKVGRPGVDIALSMEFTKARRRKPSNRADFETVTFAMVNDVWAAESAAGAVVAKNGRQMNPEATLLLRSINDEIAAGNGRICQPEPEMPLVQVISLEVLRKALVHRGWLRVSSQGFHSETIPKSEHTRLWKRIDTLKEKGLLGGNRKDVWLLKPIQTF